MVDVAVMFLDPCWIVTLWGTGELLVKSIFTAPAFAVADVTSYLSCPLGSAARATPAAGWPPLACGPASGGGGACDGTPPGAAFACASCDFGGLEAVTMAVVSVATTSSALTPITARPPETPPGNPGRVTPTTDTTTAQAASTAPAM